MTSGSEELGIAALLGVLQGLTEFLPISSSAHLLLVPWLMGWEPNGLTFDVIVHSGTLLAVIFYFRAELAGIGTDLVGSIRNRELPLGQGSLVAPIALGTVPALVFGGLGSDFIEQSARSPIVVVFTLSIFGVLLWWADRRSRGGRELPSVTLLDGLLVGAAQALALVPGVSRSGITMTAALLLGFHRVESARFSFLLAIPIITLATVRQTYQLLVYPTEWGLSSGPLLVGVLCSFGSGFLCIKYLLRFLQKRSFLFFAVYRCLLAGLILWLVLS